jgi:hypothetical protein
MLMPEFDVLADVTKCVSEQRATEKGFRVINDQPDAERSLGQTSRRDRSRGGILESTFLGVAMKEALQSTLILVLWIAFWLAGTIGGAVLQAWLIDIGVVSDIDPPWIITIGSSFIGFFAGAYAAIKLGNLALRKNNRFGSKS